MTTPTPSPHTLLPEGIESLLRSVDWSCNDVLVGSLGSVAQLEDNLARRYYYVPKKSVTDEALAVKVIALYQSRTLFGKDAGIRYYGKVSEAKELPRREIDFPMRKGNGEERYYAFRVEEWKALPITIGVRFDTVYKPRLTSSFLLEHCTESYELFGVKSSEQFVLLHEIKQLLGGISGNGETFEGAMRLRCGYSLWVHDGYLEAFDSQGTRMLDTPIRVSVFSKNPKGVFTALSDKLL